MPKGGDMPNKNKTAKRLVHALAANLRLHTYYRNNIPLSQGSFNKKFLPTPQSVLYRLGFNPKKTNHKGYLILQCPFHKNGKEHTPSLNMHSISGHYRCHACGAKGGDILAFYRDITGKSFIDAAKELGAWENRI